jgi:hypothetical protein
VVASVIGTVQQAVDAETEDQQLRMGEGEKLSKEGYKLPT